jgi:hypothetical protein
MEMPSPSSYEKLTNEGSFIETMFAEEKLHIATCSTATSPRLRECASLSAFPLRSARRTALVIRSSVSPAHSRREGPELNILSQELRMMERWILRVEGGDSAAIVSAVPDRAARGAQRSWALGRGSGKVIKQWTVFLFSRGQHPLLHEASVCQTRPSQGPGGFLSAFSMAQCAVTTQFLTMRMLSARGKDWSLICRPEFYASTSRPHLHKSTQWRFECSISISIVKSSLE